MVEFIGNETKKILFKACERYANANQKKLDQIQLILGLNVVKAETGEFGILDENELNKFTICEAYSPKKELTIWEVLNVRPKLDFLGYSKLAPPFIFKSLMRFSETYKIDLDKVFILCQPGYNEKKPDMQLALYNGYEFIKEIKFYPEEDENGDIDYSYEYLFNHQDAEMPKG
jgi:hypothetical protein